MKKVPGQIKKLISLFKCSLKRYNKAYLNLQNMFKLLFKAFHPTTTRQLHNQYIREKISNLNKFGDLLISLPSTIKSNWWYWNDDFRWNCEFKTIFHRHQKHSFNKIFGSNYLPLDIILIVHDSYDRQLYWSANYKAW